MVMVFLFFTPTDAHGHVRKPYTRAKSLRGSAGALAQRSVFRAFQRTGSLIPFSRTNFHSRQEHLRSYVGGIYSISMNLLLIVLFFLESPIIDPGYKSGVYQRGGQRGLGITYNERGRER